MKAASAVQGATPTTAAAPLALPDAPTLATKFLVPRNRRGSDDSSTHRREDKTLENNVVQAARGTFLSSPSIKTAATPLHTVSSALLDISFDSRVFAVNNATTSTEINRLGNRLRDLQHEQYDLSVARAYSVHVSSASSDIDSVSRAHHYVLENSRGISETLPDASTASLELSTGSAKPSLSDQGLRGEQLHAETVKFVSLIQEIQRMRTSGRPDYAWFRRETVLPTTNSGSSGDGGGGGESDGHGEVGAASSVVSPTLLPSISERAPPSGEGRGESVSGLNVSSDLYRQSLLRQRNRSSRSVHWLPFEMHESDPQANSSRTPMCFCGFQAENLLADSVSAACSHGCYPVTEADLDKSNSQHLLELGVLYATVIADAASHPLPLGAPPIDRSSLHRVDAETDKNNFLSDSNRPLSITADTTPCTSAPSFSNGSLSFCPVHIFYSPVSILAPRRRTKPPSPIRPSEARLPLSETLQVNVPATNRTALSPAKRPSAHPTAFATQGSTDDKPRSETGDRRPIIHVGVPHRKQLAKRALEDNRLFFSMPFQTRKKLLYSEN
ncbi:hypothetical protein JKF63_00469 [Porcisia hertigi]|uniref:Uncharacterized protein n=1 Tax=Porcisia hertigi TaxID=2761500 RepID=A0A836HD64_9TRYP|nr:hypothetical protein JKF63_00469 [Porcisia hertigi]